jgi:hypothetical protein
MTLTPTALGTTTYTIQGSNDYIPSPNVVGSNASSSGAPAAINAGNWVTLSTGEVDTFLTGHWPIVRYT